MSDGDRSDGEAWFELILHEGPPDPATWEGCGQAIAYWRGQFERLREPYPWTVSAAELHGVGPAVIPEEAIRDLPDDARISFVWTFCRT